MPYTYLIGWTKHNKFYYGVRYAKDCHPDELWQSYHTSSKHVQRFREKHGEPDIIQVRKTFKDAKSACLWENKVLKRINAKDDRRFLNATDNHAISTEYSSVSWKSLTEEQRKKRAKYASKNLSEKQRKERSRKAGLASAKKMTEEQKKERQKSSIEASKMWWSQKTDEEKSSHSRLGGIAAAKKMTEEQKRKRSERTKQVNSQKVECPHCGKIGGLSGMKSWHFDNCKQRSDYG